MIYDIVRSAWKHAAVHKRTGREVANSVEHNTLYGAGVNKRKDILLQQTGIALSDEEAAQLARNWKKAFPKVAQWHNDNARKWRAGQLEQTILGRRYKAKLLTDFNNIRISGTAAEVAKLAIHYMAQKMDLKNFLLFVHDSYTWEFDTYAQAREAANLIAVSMLDAWKEVTQHCIITDLPMPVEVSIGKPGDNWADLQNGNNVEVIEFKGETK